MRKQRAEKQGRVETLGSEVGQRPHRVLDRDDVRERIVAWFAAHARDLPWRRDSASPWHVMISEFMLQQTPVTRVLAPYAEWTTRWPTPADLAAAPTGDVVAAWGRLGYPRRALRLHAAATAIVERHGGQVPSTVDELKALPGVGDYTAAAVASFAFGRREVVLDTNVRRVLDRIELGVGLPAPTLTKAERQRAVAWLPDEPRDAATWAAASMELGALVCTAASPRCAACPVADACAYFAAGCPEPPAQHRRTQAWHGTDRQCRGLIVAALRESQPRSVDDVIVYAASHGWADPSRVAPLIDALILDGLIHRADDGLRLGSRP